LVYRIFCADWRVLFLYTLSVFCVVDKSSRCCNRVPNCICTQATNDALERVHCIMNEIILSGIISHDSICPQIGQMSTLEINYIHQQQSSLSKPFLWCIVHPVPIPIPNCKITNTYFSRSIAIGTRRSCPNNICRSLIQFHDCKLERIR